MGISSPTPLPAGPMLQLQQADQGRVQAGQGIAGHGDPSAPGAPSQGCPICTRKAVS